MMSSNAFYTVKLSNRKRALLKEYLLKIGYHLGTKHADHSLTYVRHKRQGDTVLTQFINIERAKS